MTGANLLPDDAVLIKAGPAPTAPVRPGPAAGPSLRLITLHMARCKAFPNGSAGHGYAFVAPLDADGHLDAEAWRATRERCHVRRFWGEERDRIGHLVHRRGGAGGATWCFAFRDARGDDDEAGHHLASHRFVPGEYVSIREEDDEVNTFQIAAVAEACA
jgi:hypothetical protein